jgi:hypothetical protein
LAASGHVFRTTWKWYWQDEDDQWHCYDNGNADVTSEEIEQQFQSGIVNIVFLDIVDWCIAFSWEKMGVICLRCARSTTNANCIKSQHI